MKQETMDKVIKTVNYLCAPTIAVCAIWDIDISIYASAGFGALASILSFIKLFCEE